MAKLESGFQAHVVHRLNAMFEGSYILVNDGRRIQGFPDVTVLHTSGRWATLECKRSDQEPYQPNQEYYINDMNQMAFSAMICPENEEEIMDAIQRSFGSKR